MERFSTLFFVTVRLQKQTVSIPIHCGLKQSCFTTEKPELSWNNKCDNLVQSIWVKWQKRSTGNNQRCSIKTLHQTPKTITKHTFFLHPIYFYAPSEYRGWLCNNVNKMIFLYYFFHFPYSGNTKELWVTLSVFVPSEGTEQCASTWALVRVLSADVIQCVHSCIQVRTLTFITEFFISIYARHVWTWRTLLGLLFLSLLISCYICSLSKQLKKNKKKKHWRTTVGFILRNSFPHILASFLGIPLRK